MRHLAVQARLLLSFLGVPLLFRKRLDLSFCNFAPNIESTEEKHVSGHAGCCKGVFERPIFASLEKQERYCRVEHHESSGYKQYICKHVIMDLCNVLYASYQVHVCMEAYLVNWTPECLPLQVRELQRHNLGLEALQSGLREAARAQSALERSADPARGVLPKQRANAELLNSASMSTFITIPVACVQEQRLDRFATLQAQ